MINSDNVNSIQMKWTEKTILNFSKYYDSKLNIIKFELIAPLHSNIRQRENMDMNSTMQ